MARREEKNTTQRRPEDWFPSVRAPGTASTDDLSGKVDITREVISGAGLTGGGDLSADRTFNVGAGTGLSVTADAVSLADTAVTPGSYTTANITVDQQGRVTAAANGSPMSSWKQPVRAKTTAALPANTYANGSSGVGATLTGNANGALAAQDGVTLAANDRVLVDQEATGSHNGIYVVTQLGDASHPYILTRDTDADSGAELLCATVTVSEGSTFADQTWKCTTNATITIGTTSLAFAVATLQIDTDTSLAADSDQRLATQKAIKAYVDAQSGPTASSTSWKMVDQSGNETNSPTWTWSANVSHVDVTGLGGFSQILVLYNDVTLSAADTARVVLRPTGGSFRNTLGDYKNIVGGGTKSDLGGIPIFAGTATAARSGGARIDGSNVNGCFKDCVSIAGAVSGAILFVQSTLPIDAVRIETAGGANMTGGTIEVLGAI